MLNAPEIIVIGVVTFLFVGAKRMPELAKALGQGIREFKKASSEAADEAMRAINDTPKRSLQETTSVTASDGEMESAPHDSAIPNEVQPQPQNA